MNKFITGILALCAPLLVSATEITTPNMALGRWVTTADMSAMIEKTLASMPEENRAMVRKMMEKNQRPSTISEYCITKEVLANYNQQIKGMFGGKNNCNLNVEESTSEKFVATMNCSSMVTHITTNVINAKRHESTIVSNVPGVGETKIKTVSEWKSSACQ